MLILENAELQVQVLDPVRDQERFGVRYCTGGYIFQIEDRRAGPLLTGPTFPDSFNWFDGQGIPDAFNLGPLASTEQLGAGLVIGVGQCNLRDKRVNNFCRWQVAQDAAQIEFSTEQLFESYRFALRRQVRLHHRTVHSLTTLNNLGQAALPMRWFPHPFYPQPASDELLWVNAPLRWRDDGAYRMQENGFIARSRWPWDDGHYLALDHDASAPLVLLQRHPQLGMVSAACSYVPTFFPIWGNRHTFSWEPFLERQIAPGQSLTWWIDYTF